MLNAELTDRLRDELGDDVFGLLTDTFFADFIDRLTRFEACVEKSDRGGLEFEAYSVRGAAVSIGFDGVAEAASAVAHHAKNGSWEEIKARLGALRVSVAQSVAVLSAGQQDVVVQGMIAPFSWESGAIAGGTA